MNQEDKLAHALLNLQFEELPDDQEQVRKIVARDKAWVKALTIITGLLWLVSTFMMYWFVFSLISTWQEVERAGGAGANPVTLKVYEFLIVLGASVEALIFALLGTFLLNYFSRRATLRQINTSLIAVSRQLAAQGK